MFKLGVFESSLRNSPDTAKRTLKKPSVRKPTGVSPLKPAAPAKKHVSIVNVGDVTRVRVDDVTRGNADDVTRVRVDDVTRGSADDVTRVRVDDATRAPSDSDSGQESMSSVTDGCAKPRIVSQVLKADVGRSPEDVGRSPEDEKLAARRRRLQRNHEHVERSDSELSEVIRNSVVEANGAAKRVVDWGNQERVNSESSEGVTLMNGCSESKKKLQELPERRNHKPAKRTDSESSEIIKNQDGKSSLASSCESVYSKKGAPKVTSKGKAARPEVERSDLELSESKKGTSKVQTRSPDWRKPGRPEVRTPEAKRPEMKTPEVKRPETKTPEAGQRKVFVPAGKAPLSRTGSGARSPTKCPKECAQGRIQKAWGLGAAAGRKPGKSEVRVVSFAEVYADAVNRKLGADVDGALYKDLPISEEEVEAAPEDRVVAVETLADLRLQKAKSEEQLANDRAWLEQERYWLVHRRGFTAVTKLPGKSGSMDDLATGVGTGKIRVSVLATNEEFSVDEDDLEKANPPQYDRSEDLAQLRFLNESSVLHTLRQRYAANLIHTYAGLTMLIMNPAVPLAIYSEKVAHLFRRCKSADMPAHIYSVAQSAYHSMLSLRRDHSIVFLGRAGSGKTINYKYIIKYLTIVAGANNKVLTLEKLNSIWTVLEAFGNAKTVLNNSATCFAHLFSLDFDQSGQIASASIQTMLFDRWRVARRPEGEGTFHILSRLVLGAEGNLRRDLMLGDLNPTDSNPYVHFNVSNEDKVQQAGLFKMVYGSLMQLGVSELENKIIFSVLAAILHLGAAGAAKGSTSSRWQFNSPIAAHRAAKCLGTTVEELSRIIFAPTVSTPTSNRSSYHSSSPGSDYGNRSPAVDDWTGQDALDGFVIGLYSEVFNIVAALINRHLSVGTHTVNTILVFDCPGFQNPASCGQQNGATFQDFCFNYLQERLQLLFHNTALVATRDRYTQEQIEVICDDTDEVSPEGIVNILDNIPSNNSSLSLAMRSSQLDLRQSDSTPGLLWLLDEHRSLPSQQSFVDSVFNVYREREHQTLINKAAGNHHLLIQHCQGTNPVLYNTENWTKLAREHPSTKAAVALLLESTHNDMATVFTMSRSANISSTLGGSLAGIDGTQSLRRASSIRRTFTSSSAAAIKRKSVALQVKFAVDGLIETLRRSKVKFVHCLLAQHNVAAVDGTKEYFDSTINVPLLRSQIRGAEVLPAVRLYKQGFPECMQLTEFIRRFGLLASSSNSTEASTPTPTDTKTSIEEILFGIDLDASSYRVGLSQIFFRSGVLAQLELQRDAKLTDRIIKLQSHCRGYLARKKLAKLKVEDLAVRCIQRNVRKFMSVRDWAWWRLLVRVTPLLNVHRTEEELKSKTEELESLRAKLDKLEQERNLLKHETDKLETKLSEMTVDLAEEHSTATVASERLEIETSERLRLEKELQEIQIKNKRLQENGERLELEVLHLHSADVNGSALHSEDDDDESGDRTGVYKRRYERVARELEFAKRRLDQQHQDDLEQLIGLRKQLEKKLADAYEEVEEQRQVVAQWKRKVQKLNSELNDVRLLLEEQNSRNILLEKKQRKFDAELQMLQDELRQERQQKERSSREREIAVSEKYSMEQTLSAVKLELELKEQKLVNLNRELEELMFNGSTEEEVANLKKSKHQLDNKIKDQEEELDDLAGQVQMLEQAKLKLEMSLEQMRKEHRRELMQKDDEIEDARCSAVKKVKALECQLESEHEERTLLLRERHELERRLNDLEDRERVNRTSDQEQLNRLRRDLKRTKALLQDAQIMLQQAKADTPNKTILRQLRNQLEDAECARNLAIKARQTAEADLLEVQLALEEATRAKNEAEEKSAVISRERSQLQTQLDENEEELAEVLKKYRATVQQLSSEQSQLREQVGKIVELETERQSLKEQLNEMTSRLENVGSMNDPVSSLTVKRLELKCKELESKLELEQTTRSRMEVQISRLKETVERLQSDTDIAKGREAAAQDLVRKLQRNIRDLKEQLSQHESRENSETVKRKELEKRLEESEAETSAAKTDLRLALQRIEDLQLAIQGELDQDDEDDDSATDSDNSASSDESFESFLTNHNSGSADRSSVIRSNFSRSEEVSPLKITNSSASAKESSSPPSSFA
ncbi:unconventional myosin-XVIIIa isoform X2 [Bemisia tabaci]|uniref:unconventional myosin-XVIIIa isoform X2 n=1 Tax=Bemisia tabaci TaxID=7038 RepID=UPI003B28D353